MILLENSAAVSFKLQSRKGSAYVESALVMPLTCLIIIGLMGIIMTFHGQLLQQVSKHKAEAANWECSNQLQLIRIHDSFTRGFYE